MELNKRELDEGDLFGIRAIQSGYFGGVAQSRPASVAGDHSPEGSISNTLLGSEQSPKQSPKLRPSSPMASTLSLPALETRHSASPLRKTIVADNNIELQTSSSAPHTAQPTLHPSGAHINRSTNVDPTVNMYLNVPPSPVDPSRHSNSVSDISDRSPKGSPDLNSHDSAEVQGYPFPEQHGGHNVPSHAAHNSMQDDMRSTAQTVEPTGSSYSAIHSQSASIVSRSSDTSRREDYRSSIQDEEGFSSAPSKQRPVSSKSMHPSRTSSYGTPTRSTENLMQYEQESIPPPPRVASATMSDWGPSIFQEIDQTLSGTQEDSRHNHHASHLSDSSSVYSFAPSAHRQSAKRSSTAAPYISRTSDMSDNRPQSQRASMVEGARRASDALSHHLPSSDQSTSGNSHRNTRELGDLYDSYWRHSKQGQQGIAPPGSTAQRPGGTGPEGNYGNRQNVYVPDRAQDGFGARRGNYLEVHTQPTIAEVPSPVQSPLPTATIGKAM